MDWMDNDSTYYAIYLVHSGFSISNRTAGDLLIKAGDLIKISIYLELADRQKEKNLILQPAAAEPEISPVAGIN